VIGVVDYFLLRNPSAFTIHIRTRISRLGKYLVDSGRAVQKKPAFFIDSRTYSDERAAHTAFAADNEAQVVAQPGSIPKGEFRPRPDHRLSSGARQKGSELAIWIGLGIGTV
jgi:hypothetical protein